MISGKYKLEMVNYELHMKRKNNANGILLFSLLFLVDLNTLNKPTQMDFTETKHISNYKKRITRNVMVNEKSGKFHVFIIDTDVDLKKARTYGLIEFQDGTLEWVYKTQVKFVISS